MRTQPTSVAHSVGESHTSPALGPIGASEGSNRIPSWPASPRPLERHQDVAVVEGRLHRDASACAVVDAEPHPLLHLGQQTLGLPRTCHAASVAQDARRAAPAPTPARSAQQVAQHRVRGEQRVAVGGGAARQQLIGTRGFHQRVEAAPHGRGAAGHSAVE